MRTRLLQNFFVQAGGITVVGGLTMYSGGIRIDAGGLSVVGGVTVYSAGLVITAGGITVGTGGIYVGDDSYFDDNVDIHKSLDVMGSITASAGTLIIKGIASTSTITASTSLVALGSITASAGTLTIKASRARRRLPRVHL